MRAAFKRDFDIDYEGADPKLQLGYANGFAAAKNHQSPPVDFDHTATPSLRDIALREFKEQIKPHLLD